jgi:hypothetical protein
VETLLNLEFIWAVVDVVREQVFGAFGDVGHLEPMLLYHSAAPISSIEW